jgi:hypothetical protein
MANSKRPPDDPNRTAQPRPFDSKTWLDRHVVPLLVPSFHLHSLFFNGQPPANILVYLLANQDTLRGSEDRAAPDQALSWAQYVKHLLEERSFRFDLLRDVQLVPLGGAMVPIFGGDGAPFCGKNGMVSVRLYQAQDDGVGLILQIGAAFKPLAAASAIKDFFGQFDASPFETIDRFKTVWGQG